MAFSKELSAFNIHAILASTVDQTPQEVMLMKQFVNHERGLCEVDKIYYLDVYILNSLYSDGSTETDLFVNA